MTIRVVIMAGGTGGHVFPALAVANELRRRDVIVSWIGTKRGLESEVIAKADIPIDWVSISGLRGNGLLDWLSAPYRLIVAVYQVMRVFKKRKPDVVLGMGGFVSGPGGLAARLAKTPLVIHEQNSIPGLTNKLLSKIAQKILVAFPSAFAEKMQAENTGNPLRADFSSFAEPGQRLKTHKGVLHLLVIGGSLGASVLNKVVPEALAKFELTERPKIWHQTGKKHLEQTNDYYGNANVDARIEAFIDNMSEAYGWADLVLCRAGALTISELSAVGVGSILVPYPFAVDDHQTKNAQYLVDAGAAELIQQTDFSREKLYGLLVMFGKQKNKLLHMANQARGLARPNATSEVADYCMELANV